jgi:hypothetical protein
LGEEATTVNGIYDRPEDRFIIIVEWAIDKNRVVLIWSGHKKTDHSFLAGVFAMRLIRYLLLEWSGALTGAPGRSSA